MTMSRSGGALGLKSGGAYKFNSTIGGSSELIDRLSKLEHAGRTFFWFS